MQIREPTDEQKRIILDEGNVVVTAKPGSGKTFTIVEKISKISDKLLSYQGIIAISFTRKASRELEQRAKYRGIPKKQSFYGTIDSFYVSQIIMPFAKHLTGKTVQLEVKAKVEEYPEYAELTNLRNGTTPELEALLVKSFCNGHIFLDLCGETALFILQHIKEATEYLLARYTHIFIDEYQDCGEIQHKIFTLLVDRGLTGVAVGDIDQAIYAFSKRYPKYLVSLLTHEKFSPYEITKNHRCHESISDYSLRLLGKDVQPKEEKRVFKVSLMGDETTIAKKITTLLPQIKARYDTALNNKVAILCRSNATASKIALNFGLPYKLFVDTELDSYNSYWARFFNDFLQSYFSPEVFSVDFTEQYFDADFDRSNYQKALRIIDTLFALGATELSDHLVQIVGLAKMAYPEYEKSDVVEILKDILSDQEKLHSYAPAMENEVNIMSLHKSKGLEFDIVFHLDLYEYIMPMYNCTPEDYEQALNLHYVGITRAKKVCYIMQGTIRHNANGDAKKANPSEFLQRNNLSAYRHNVVWK